MKKIKTIIYAFGIQMFFLAYAYGQDGKPFIHPFGELRVYYQDWLVVCEGKGKGVCRMVNIKLATPSEHFFGDSQLTIYPGSQQPRKSAMPEYANAAFINFFKRGMLALQGKVTVIIDGKVIAQLQPNENIFDNTSIASKNKAIAMETYWLEGDVAWQILKAMPAGNRLSIRYWQNNTEQTETFSLRGAAKSLAFIANKVHAKAKH